MQQISFFLQKFKTLGLESAAIKAAFVEAVEKILQAKIDPENVRVKDGVLFVRAHPALKSELFLKKRLFIEELSKVLGPMKVTGLR